jgi:hypothetical protein
VTTLEGKMTKPEIWSRILYLHEISVLATGCGITTSSDITVKEIKARGKERFTHGECLTGKGKH